MKFINFLFDRKTIKMGCNSFQYVKNSKIEKFVGFSFIN